MTGNDIDELEKETTRVPKEANMTPKVNVIPRPIYGDVTHYVKQGWQPPFLHMVDTTGNGRVDHVAWHIRRDLARDFLVQGRNSQQIQPMLFDFLIDERKTHSFVEHAWSPRFRVGADEPTIFWFKAERARNDAEKAFDLMLSLNEKPAGPAPTKCKNPNCGEPILDMRVEAEHLNSDFCKACFVQWALNHPSDDDVRRSLNVLGSFDISDIREAFDSVLTWTQWSEKPTPCQASQELVNWGDAREELYETGCPDPYTKIERVSQDVILVRT